MTTYYTLEDNSPERELSEDLHSNAAVRCPLDLERLVRKRHGLFTSLVSTLAMLGFFTQHQNDM